MCKNYVIEMNPDELMKVECCKFDKNLKVDAGTDYCMFVSHKDNHVRVENGNLKETYKNNKMLRGKDVEITIYRGDKLKRIPMEIGQIRSGQDTIEFKGSFDFRINNFILFQKRFGQNIKIRDFRNTFVEMNHKLIRTFIRECFNKYEFDLKEMNRRRNEISDALIDEFKRDEMLLVSMGIELSKINIKSFTIMKKENNKNEK